MVLQYQTLHLEEKRFELLHNPLLTTIKKRQLGLVMNYIKAKLEGKWCQYGENPPPPHHGLFYHAGYQYSIPIEQSDALPMGIPEAITKEEYRTALRDMLYKAVLEKTRELDQSAQTYQNVLHSFDTTSNTTQGT